MVALRVGDLLFGSRSQLRYEPTPRWIRAMLDGETVVDSRRAILVWEPGAVVPHYAVPAEDVRAPIAVEPPPATAPSVVTAPSVAAAGTSSVSTAREPSARVAAASSVRTVSDRRGPGFRFADPDLAGYVGLTFDAFDAWFEEDEKVTVHPHDPFHRIDIRRSSRHVRIELDGHVLAESGRPRLLFETHLPVRFYLPPQDINRDLLRSSTKQTACPYKGRASYWSLDLDDRTVDDLAWSYDAPLPEAAAIAGMVAFFDERVDVVLDGQRCERPRTPWSLPDS